jgi:hypothetical protein
VGHFAISARNRCFGLDALPPRFALPLNEKRYCGTYRSGKPKVNSYLACYYCQLKHLQTAKDYLKKVFEINFPLQCFEPPFVHVHFFNDDWRDLDSQPQVFEFLYEFLAVDQI